MKKKVILFLFIIGVDALISTAMIFYYRSVQNSIREMEVESRDIWNHFSELDKKHTPRLEAIDSFIQNSLNGSFLKALPDSVRTNIIKQKDIGTYFIDYKNTIEYDLKLFSLGIREKSEAITFFFTVSIVLLLLGSLVLFKLLENRF